MIENKDLGLKQNWQQFSLLVIVNAFVGGMVGLERTIFPQFAEEEFSVSSNAAILSFIVAFGISKAVANYFTGKLADKIGRKKLLILGWLIAIPVPLILLYANNWNQVVIANVLLGVSQGFAWSSTVVMKIDLVGEKDRGLAMGLNEFAGYFAVGVMAFVSGWLAAEFGLKPYPFVLGLVLAVVGLILSFFVHETHHFVVKESLASKMGQQENVFIETSFKNKALSSITQAGLVNNLNDGMIWGLLPKALLALDFSGEQIAIVAAVYPGVWGIGQLFTGKMSDHFSKKKMLFWGMLLQGIAIIWLSTSADYFLIVTLAVSLGLGTALVYPTFLSAIAGATHPRQRGESVGVFRLWRDLGYAVGAIFSGLIADFFGVNWAIAIIGLVTICSALVIQIRMPELK